MNNTSHRLALIIGAAALVVSACGGGDDESTDTTVPTTTQAPSTTAATTTTTTTLPPATTLAGDVLRMPLTGEPILSEAEIPNRPALIVKIPVDAKAMPHIGLNDTDIVFQTIINDSFTRYLAVFHTGDSDPVGPIRSGRLQDIDIMAAFQEPLYAWSGGNAGVTRVMREADDDDLLVNLNASNHADLYYRMSGRGGAPHNLFSSTDALWEATPEEFRKPTPVFPYLDPDTEPEGEPADEINVTLDSINSQWEYDTDTGRYFHVHQGEDHMTEFDGQVWADNVVVMMMDYGRSPIDGGNPLMESLGSNAVYVFSRGTVREGVWVRFENTDGWGFYDNVDDLNPIGLVAGRTWVEMPRNSEGNITYSADGGEQITPTTVEPGVMPTSVPTSASTVAPSTTEP